MLEARELPAEGAFKINYTKLGATLLVTKARSSSLAEDRGQVAQQLLDEADAAWLFTTSRSQSGRSQRRRERWFASKNGSKVRWSPDFFGMSQGELGEWLTRLDEPAHGSEIHERETHEEASSRAHGAWCVRMSDRSREPPPDHATPCEVGCTEHSPTASEPENAHRKRFVDVLGPLSSTLHQRSSLQIVQSNSKPKFLQ